MNLSLRNSLISCSLVIAVCFGISSCKEKTIINANLVPTVDNINTFAFPDTLSIITKTVIDDSVNTSSTAVTPFYVGIGSVKDPYFGTSVAGAYLQFVPLSVSYTFYNTVDSAFIVLPYSGFSWGDTNVAQNFTAYRLADTLNYTSNYYTFNRKAKAEVIGTATNVTLPGMRNSMKYVDTAITTAQLKIKLTSDFKNKLVDSSAQYSTHPDFLLAFKGIYIVPSDTLNPAAAAIHYFAPSGTAAYSTAGFYFYHNNGTVDSLLTYYNFSSSYGAHYTQLIRNYTGTTAQSFFNSTAVSDSLMLLQNEPGATLDITIPNIQSIPKALINKAELVITMTDKDNQAVTYTAPSRIYPVGVDASGALYSIADRLAFGGTSYSSPLTFIDGYSKVNTVNGRQLTQYSINFPKELQQAIARGQSSLHLRINGTQTFPGAYRLIAGGRTNADPDVRLKLNIIYSKLN